MDNSFIALGLMSGTSLDGIDASIIKSDGENYLDIIDNKYFNYPEAVSYTHLTLPTMLPV